MHSNERFNRGLVRQYHKWMIANHYVKSSQDTYLRALGQYVQFLHKRSVATARHTEIRLFIAHASENGATLSTVYRYLGILRQFYDFLNLGGVVDYVAPRFVRLRVPWRNRLGTLTRAQMRALIAATETARERALIEFFYSTGCRLNEAVQLKIADLDFAVRQAKVRGKFGKARMVLLSESAVKALRSYIGDRKKGYAFEPDYRPDRGHFCAMGNAWISTWRYTRKSDNRRRQKSIVIGSTERMTLQEAKRKHEALMKTVDYSVPPRSKPMSKMGLADIITKIGARAGLKNVTAHTFRRTFATHLHEGGASLEVIRSLLGHVFIQTTLRYARIGPDSLSKSFERHHPMGNRYENSPE